MNEELNDLLARRAHLMTYAGMKEQMERRINELTMNLIAKDDEQARGAIKELRRLIELPDDLEAEASHLAAALSANADAA